MEGYSYSKGALPVSLVWVGMAGNMLIIGWELKKFNQEGGKTGSELFQMGYTTKKRIQGMKDRCTRPTFCLLL